MRSAGPLTFLWGCTLLLVLAACSADDNACDGGCGTGLSCVQNSDFPAGNCTAVCDGGGCPSGMVCSPLLSTGQRYCLQDCADGGCPGSTVCSLTSLGRVCLPPSQGVATPIGCAAPRLLVGPAAGPPVDPSCQTPVVASALPPADVQHLGTYSPGTQVSFSVPAGAVGFSIVSQAVSGASDFIFCSGEFVPNFPVPSPLLTPVGATFFDITTKPPLDLTTAPLLFFATSGPQPFTAALTFPNTSAGLSVVVNGGLPAGDWTFVVNDWAHEVNDWLHEIQAPSCDTPSASNTYDVSVIVTPGPLPSVGTLAVDVYLVTETLDAGSAVNAAGVQKFATRFSDILANAGVCVGTVTFHDVPAWAVAKYSSVDVDDEVTQQPCSDFRQMFTLAESGRSTALFFVDDMVLLSGETNGILGVDGSIPGTATYNGTIGGGAAVLAADLSATGCTSAYQPFICGADLVAGVSAHETGHFLGLVHPTEQTGEEFDPLADTPTCVCELCETDPGAAAACGNNPDGGQSTQVYSECSGATQLCGGQNLLMFWAVSPKAEITPQEAAVIRANPLISAP